MSAESEVLLDSLVNEFKVCHFQYAHRFSNFKLFLNFSVLCLVATPGIILIAWLSGAEDFAEDIFFVSAYFIFLFLITGYNYLGVLKSRSILSKLKNKIESVGLKIISIESSNRYGKTINVIPVHEVIEPNLVIPVGNRINYSYYNQIFGIS